MEKELKTYVWGIPTRLFHWMMVVSLVGAYIAEEDYLTLHVAFGYTAGILIFFRLIWGIVGPKYSHFRDFPMSIKSITGFIKGLGKTGKVYAGHNPPASVVMLGIMLMVVLVAISGMLTLSQEGGQGLLKSLTLPSGIEFKEIHEVFVQILIGLTILHLLGIISDLILHKSASVLKSMFTGYKTGIEEENAGMNGFQKFFSFVWIIAPLVAFYLTITGPPILLKDDEGEDGTTEMVDEEGEGEEGEED
ncbi:MAG: cytochrome b/b6 domain-containing protein [Bacteroidales bacterium]|nr:cytochrome b/b6 domain-containing protein [Bacteroidales bacterium]